MSTKTKKWIHSLVAAFIGGAATSVSVMVIDPEAFNLAEGLLKVLKVFVFSGVLNACFYLKQSPVPPLEEDCKEVTDSNSFKGLLIIGSILILMLSGCATTGPRVDPVEGVEVDKVAEARALVKRSIPYIRAAANAATLLAVQYAEKDPVRQIELREKIYIVSLNLEALLVSDDFSPSDVVRALKIQEDYVDDVLAAVALLYSATYDQLAENDNAELAIEVLRALSKGVKEATTRVVYPP